MKFLTGTHTSLLSTSILLLRLTIGIILFVIGCGKVFGWFGGQGLGPTVDAFSKMGYSKFFIYLSCYTEMIGGFLLMMGFMTRPAAFFVMINMLVATFAMLPNGFFRGGAAYPFSLMISAIIILLTGPMAYSLDAWLFSKKTKSPT